MTFRLSHRLNDNKTHKNRGNRNSKVERNEKRERGRKYTKKKQWDKPWIRTRVWAEERGWFNNTRLEMHKTKSKVGRETVYSVRATSSHNHANIQTFLRWGDRVGSMKPNETEPINTASITTQMAGIRSSCLIDPGLSCFVPTAESVGSFCGDKKIQFWSWISHR